MACINPNSPEFKAALERNGGNPLLAEIELDKGIKPGVQELFESNPELANQVYEALGFNKGLKSITPKVNIVNYRTMDDKSKENAINGVEEAQKRWVEEEIAEFYEAVEQYNKGLDTFSSKGIKKGKATIDDVIDETLGIFRTIQMFPKFSDSILPYLNDIKTALNTFGRKEGYAIYKAKKDAKNQAKEMTYENLFEVVDKYIKSTDVDITSQQKQQALQLYSQYLDTIFPDGNVKDIFTLSTTFNLLKDPSKGIQSLISKYRAFKGFIVEPSNTGNLYPKNSMYKDYKVIINPKDGLIEENGREGYKIAVESRIHVLGSKQDIEGFKEFVGKEEVELSPEEMYQKSLDLSDKEIEERINKCRS